MNKSSPKIVTAEKAIEAVKSHDDVVLANFCGEPRLLPMALMNRAHELLGVRIFHYAAFGPFQDRYLEPGMEKHIRCATAFCGRRRSVRQLLNEGRADFYPVTFGNTPRLLREGDFRSDVLLLTVSPPGRDGYCSLGVSVDYAKGALERPPRVVIAEVNPNMPKTHGRSFIHVSKIDHIVEVDQPLYELEQSPITEVQVRIGQHVAALVEDCSTLQIGYGGVSEAMVHFLQDKKNLGIHTEMVPEGLRELVAAGAITNARKSIHQGKIVCTFHGGTTKLYEWLNDNPLIEMQPVDYTNDPEVIAMNSEMVAINAALQVDLFGNIYSDLLGLEDQYTGSGGQLDFAIGCTLAHDAKFVTVLPSTTSDEKSSRIVTHPTLEINNPLAPQIPTVPRYYADYVVTEYGVAHLKGKPNTERAKALIQIAHPNFQGILRQQAKELGLL
ncbi:MAG: acetyl-CoA hydrolase/transferase family protein [Chloroflexota bacterium]|nr:MAG: acetyl-CoA hydrolase/transferase family protein [Chloroflexota bacterium]